MYTARLFHSLMIHRLQAFNRFRFLKDFFPSSFAFSIQKKNHRKKKEFLNPSREEEKDEKRRTICTLEVMRWRTPLGNL